MTSDIGMTVEMDANGPRRERTATRQAGHESTTRALATTARTPTGHSTVPGSAL
jgi:hypothetical protein